MERALVLDPLSVRFNWNWGKLLFFMRQYDRAIDQFRKTLDLDANHAGTHEWLGYAYEQKGMQREAIAEWERSLTLGGESDVAALRGRTFASSGFDAAVGAWGQKRLEQLNAKAERGDYVPAVEYLTAYMQLDDKEQAFVWLAKAAQERNRIAFEISVNPLFDPLRGDARFDAFLASLAPKARKQ